MLPWSARSDILLSANMPQTRFIAALKHTVSPSIEMRILPQPTAAITSVIVPAKGSHTVPSGGEKRFTIQTASLMLFSVLLSGFRELGFIGFLAVEQTLLNAAMYF